MSLILLCLQNHQLPHVNTYVRIRIHIMAYPNLPTSPISQRAPRARIITRKHTNIALSSNQTTQPKGYVLHDEPFTSW